MKLHHYYYSGGKMCPYSPQTHLLLLNRAPSKCRLFQPCLTYYSTCVIDQKNERARIGLCPINFSDTRPVLLYHL